MSRPQEDLPNIFPAKPVRFIDVNNPDKQDLTEATPTSIAYEDSGPPNEGVQEARTLILSPALGDRRQSYRFLGPLLVREGFRVLVADLRGTGQSGTGFSSYTPEDVASDMDAVMQHAKVESGIVVGNSLSGCSANILAADHPERVKGIVHLGGILRVMPADKFFKPISYALFFKWWGAAAWLMYFDMLFQTKPDDYAEYREALKHNLMDEQRLSATKSFIQASKASGWEKAVQVKQPTLFIVGTKDPDFPDTAKEPDVVKQHMKNAKVESILVENAGHYVHVERPEEICQYMTNFINSSIPQ